METEIEQLKEELCSIYQESYNWSLGCVGYQPEIAQEVLQESYIKALRNIDQFNSGAKLKTWFFTIIRNTSKDFYRTKYSKDRVKDKYKEQMKVKKTATQELRFRKQKDKENILKLLNSLSSREREIIELVVYQELTVKEAAEVMGVKLGTASSYLKRAKENMKGNLAQPSVLTSTISFESTWANTVNAVSLKKGA